MQPVKLGGLTLKSEVPSLKEREEDAIVDDSGDPAFAEAAPEGIMDGLKDEDETLGFEESPVETEELPITSQLKHIIITVEDFPKDDNTIKAIGKLKGALQLLS